MSRLATIGCAEARSASIANDALPLSAHPTNPARLEEEIQSGMKELEGMLA